MDDSTKQLLFIILTLTALSVIVYSFYKCYLETPDIAAPIDPTKTPLNKYEIMLEKSAELFARLDPGLPRITREQAVEHVNQVLKATRGLSGRKLEEKTVDITTQFLYKLQENNLAQKIMQESATKNLSWLDSFFFRLWDLNLIQVSFLAIVLALIFFILYYFFRYRKYNS